ncbi:hypothetical protein PLCT2_00458 [Planctomycetaceae bacterium]|nr:hypothetical protein PLCT2_00458 [Planctomycetaceae bacterium]
MKTNEPDSRVLDTLGMWLATTAMIHDITEDHVVQTLPASRLMVEVQSLCAEQEPGQSFLMGVLSEPQDGVQLARLRYALPDGRTPVIFAPSTAPQAFETCALGLHVLSALRAPVFISLEAELENFGDLKPPAGLPGSRSLKLSRKFDMKLSGDEIADCRYFDLLVRENADALSRSTLDKQPKRDTSTDWLVISYGCTAHAAQEAVDAAREKGLGVDHLVLQTLSPLPERVIAAAAMGKKFVVVPERNLGQLHPEIQRLCPSLPCVLVSNATAPVRKEQVLEALLRFPRCC